jgi:pilus assembly protein CpaD
MIGTSTMNRIAHLLPALAVALSAGACQSFDERYQASLPVDQRLPFQVSTEVALLDVQTDGRGRLTGQSQVEVERFLRAYKTDGSGALEIQTAGGSRATAAEGQIRDIASISGIPRNRIALTSYAATPGQPGLRLAFARYTASVPACDVMDWSQDLDVTVNNTAYPSFGCATQKNIAAMAADPRDLVEARPMDEASAERRSVKTDKYEKGESPSSARTAGDSGKLAEVASGTERQ